MTNEQAMETAKQLREFCKGQTSCETCVFGIKEDVSLAHCALDTTPFEYNIDRPIDVYSKR